MDKPMKPRRRYVMRPPRVPPGTEAPGQRELLAIREVVHAFLLADRPDEAFQFDVAEFGALGAQFLGKQEARGTFGIKNRGIELDELHVT